MTDDERLEALEAERLAVQAQGGEAVATTVRDAATLIIVDESRGEPRFLMGLRGKAHVFMANRFVFPGGRVEQFDRDYADGFELAADADTRLCASTSSVFTARDAAALALAAIRETFEETGLLIAEDRPPQGRVPTAFAAFAERGLTPAAGWLVPVARAITPEGAPRRFDTRFFVINASRLSAISETFEPPTDEFDEIAWVPTSALSDHSLAPITRSVLQDVTTRIEDGTWLDASHEMPFYRVVDGGFRKDLI
ncbi:NUDIX hydrolase [Jiella mangrovi]|uniref:NUDIX domain-containing protein n=1 Tax=Jiella mangrovi TaxID=2821407 RepID=A0ABS4BGT1_9HYPH|nr:NUDIX domain-containing protein [Jiella mangrovi]